MARVSGATVTGIDPAFRAVGGTYGDTPRFGTFSARSVAPGAMLAGTTLRKFGGTRPPGIAGGMFPMVPTLTTGAEDATPTPGTGGRVGGSHPAGPCTTGTGWKPLPHQPLLR